MHAEACGIFSINYISKLCEQKNAIEIVILSFRKQEIKGSTCFLEMSLEEGRVAVESLPLSAIPDDCILHTDLHKIIERRENHPGSVARQSINKTSQVIKAII